MGEKFPPWFSKVGGQPRKRWSCPLSKCNMTSVVVVGTQWGWWGKGRENYRFPKSRCQWSHVIRWRCHQARLLSVVRNLSKLHLIPSGIFFPENLCYRERLASGQSKSLVKSWRLHAEGVSTKPSYFWPCARYLAGHHIKRSEAAKGDNKIGTTNKGRLPIWIRLRVDYSADLWTKEIFADRLKTNLKNRAFSKMYEAEGYHSMRFWNTTLTDNKLSNTSGYVCIILNDAADTRQTMTRWKELKGLCLTIDQVLYPFVTSSKQLRVVLQRCSFPTELFDEVGERIREVGHE